MTVADRIITRRKELHLSQEEVAKKLGLSDRSSITKIEKSGNEITIKNIGRIAEVLNCTVEYLMGFENKNDDPVKIDPVQENIIADIRKLNDRQLKLLKAYIELLTQQEDK